MPAKWFTEEYEQKRKRCNVPDDLEFKEKTKLAVEMLDSIIEKDRLPFRWVLCDDDYGKAPWLLDHIAAKKKCYFADVPKNTQVFIHCDLLPAKHQKSHRREATPRTVGKIAVRLGRRQWHKATVKEGAKGPIVAEFACFRAFEVRNKLPGSEIWVVIRRTLDEEPDYKYFLSNAPITTCSQTLVNLSGKRWPIETIFQEEKDHLGMDHYEVRSWIGWHHQMTLSLLAHYFLVRLKNQLKDDAPELTLPQARLLLSAALPQRELDAVTVLKIVRYYQRQNRAAAISHRKATLRRHRRRKSSS
jgi:SRSO17 transposase